MIKRYVCLLWVILSAQSVFADVLGLDVFGLSIHLSAGSPKPRALDSKSIFVVNPGLGLDYDFRDRTVSNGFSVLLKTGFFQDCSDYSVFYGAAGTRYAYLFLEDYWVGASVVLGLASGKEWSTRKRKISLMPLPFLELGRKIYQDDSIQMGLSFAPHNDSISATSGSGLFFVLMSYRHNL